MPIPSTPEILLRKHLNKNVNERWVQWAVNMLAAGYDSEHLVELAGISPPFNQFELKRLTDKVFDELGLDFRNKEKVEAGFVVFMTREALDGKRDLLEVLRHLKDLCIERDYDKRLRDFYLLFFALEDIREGQDTHYWPDATSENIDQIVRDYFEEWLKENGN